MIIRETGSYKKTLDNHKKIYIHTSAKVLHVQNNVVQLDN